MIRVVVEIRCDRDGCERTTKGAAQGYVAVYSTTLQLLDVQVEDGPDGEPTKWGQDVSGVYCPEHAPEVIVKER